MRSGRPMVKREHVPVLITVAAIGVGQLIDDCIQQALEITGATGRSGRVADAAIICVRVNVRVRLRHGPL